MNKLFSIFNNAPNKIRLIAKIDLIASIIFAFIFAIASFIDDISLLIYAILLPIAAIIEGIILYGFAELIETNKKIADNLQSNKQESEPDTNQGTIVF